jgi:hypothetical protein
MTIKQIKALTEHIDGKMVAIASTDTVDRTGDSLKIADWDFKNFKKNPVLLAGHDYRPQYVIGVAKNIRSEGNKIIFEPIFHTITNIAKELKQMYEEGILKAWSVGFIPGDSNELLEVSAVAVPANAEALMLEVKSLKGIKKKQVESQINEFVDEEKEDEITAEEKKDEIIDVPKEDTTIEETEEVEAPKIDDIELTDTDIKKYSKKSPACRQENETAKECMSRKIPEIVDEGTDQEQAVAIAANLCKTKCSAKKDTKILIEVDGEVVEGTKEPETIAEELNEEEQRKRKYQNMSKVDNIVYAFYKVYFDNNTPVEKFNDLLTEAIDLMSGLLSSGEIVEKKELKDFSGGINEIYEMVQKEGRVLSGKNRSLISDCVNLLKNSATALDNLLEATTSEKKEVETKVPETVAPEKVEIPRKALKTPMSKEQLAVRILKEISKNSSYGLNQLKIK